MAKYSREFYKVFKQKYIDLDKNIFKDFIDYFNENENFKFSKDIFFT